MGTLCGKQQRHLIDKTVLVDGYCREHQIDLQIEIPNEVKGIITEFVDIRETLSSTNIVSDEHINILSQMDVIHVPRGKYEVGAHKLLIYTDQNVAHKLKAYCKAPSTNQSIIIGELGMGMGFTSLICYRVGIPENGTYFYDENAYYQTSIGGMNGYDQESSNKRFTEGGHLEDVNFCHLIDAVNHVWRKKQQLLGAIPWTDSEEVEDASDPPDATTT
eukprot:1089029_1